MKFVASTLVALLMAACAAIPVPSPTPSPPAATATPQLTATATLPQISPAPAPTATPSPSPSAIPTGLAHFEDPFLAFDYPAYWGNMTFDCGKTISECENDPCFEPGCGIKLIYFSTVPFKDPCTTAGDEIRCGWPIDKLEPNGLVAVWTRRFAQEIPFSFDPSAYPLVSAGGRTATWQVLPQGTCDDVGGTTGFVVTVPDPAATLWRTDISGCLAGPDTATLELQLRQMLSSIDWLRPADFQVRYVNAERTLGVDVFDPAGLAKTVKPLDQPDLLLGSQPGENFAVAGGGKRLDVAWAGGSVCALPIVGLMRVDQHLVVTIDRGQPSGPCVLVGLIEGRGVSITLSDAISADEVELRDW